LISESDFEFTKIYFQALAITSNPFLVKFLCGANHKFTSLISNQIFYLDVILKSQNILSCIIHSILKQESVELITFFHSICQHAYYNPDLTNQIIMIKFILNHLIFPLRSQTFGLPFLNTLIAFSFGCSSLENMIGHKHFRLSFSLYLPIIFSNFDLLERNFQIDIRDKIITSLSSFHQDLSCYFEFDNWFV
jgi:hypothetical protein